jgi:hypothetical protein
MTEFTIDEQYFTSVPHSSTMSFTVLETGERYENVSFTSDVDHPEFDKLRRSLGEQGFISIVESSWNGDTVLKPFKLNGMKFRKGDRFPCASAMEIAYNVARKFGKNTIS